MHSPLIAIIGDISPARADILGLFDLDVAKNAAIELGDQLARRNARLMVYGGPYLEKDVVSGYVKANPRQDHSILMWYSQEQMPPPFSEEATHPKLFKRRADQGTEWEVAFYRSIASADAVLLMGGGRATKISGLVAIGSRIPILALRQFGGGASEVWSVLAAGEDLPTREEISEMAQPWTGASAVRCVDALFAQIGRRRSTPDLPRPAFAIVAALLFVAALSIIPAVWGGGAVEVWMLFLAPTLSGAAGALARPIADRLRGHPSLISSGLSTFVLGLLAGGIAGVLFVTAQLTGDPQLALDAQIADYARRSIPFAVAVGFIAGLTSDVVFTKLSNVSVLRTDGAANPH
jgi:hypothetical protein